jgi:hypothetical protein
MYITRFKADKLKAGALVEILIAHGYKIKANRVRKKNKWHINQKE